MSGLVKTHYLNKNSKKTVKNCDAARVPIGTQSDIYIYFFSYMKDYFYQSKLCILSWAMELI